MRSTFLRSQLLIAAAHWHTKNKRPPQIRFTTRMSLARDALQTMITPLVGPPTLGRSPHGLKLIWTSQGALAACSSMNRPNIGEFKRLNSNTLMAQFGRTFTLARPSDQIGQRW